jgi:site-specific recombinase XerD
MGMEQVYECPRTLKQTRSGPLGGLLDGFCDWLVDKGFSRVTTRAHLGHLRRLNDYLAESESIARQRISSDNFEHFLLDYADRFGARSPGYLHRFGHTRSRFTTYLTEVGAFDSPTLPPALYQPLLDAYLRWMAELRHAAVGTLEVRKHSLRIFLQWLGPQAAAEEIQNLRAEDVECFFLAYAEEAGRSSRRSMQAAMRTFLCFALQQGYLQERLDYAVPTLRTYKLASMPRGLDDEQVKKVLESVNRDTPVGRRDYAILQLLHGYGVRGGQVRALQLSDIDWARDLILFRALKGGKESRLPLTREVGESLLDYLQHGRPSSSSPVVFLTSRAPFRPFAGSSTLSQIVRTRITGAGIEQFHKGTHLFRHSFATRMVAQGHSLKAVADVLGHRRLSTTFIYTKVDFSSLKKVALDWPQEEIS